MINSEPKFKSFQIFICISLLYFVISAPLLSWAAPSAEALDILRQTYNPQISFDFKYTGPSTLNCPMFTTLISGQDPVTGEVRQVQVKEYLPRTWSLTKNLQNPIQRDFKGQKTVILMPPTGGENLLDNYYANSLCKNGFRVALVQKWAYDDVYELDLGMHHRGTLRAQAAVRHILEYVLQTGSGKVGILGTSVGAITSALVLGIESRISTGFLIVGGGGMSQIISESTEENLTKLRDRRFAHFGYSGVQEYQQELRKRIFIDPLDFAQFSGPKNVFFVIATKDSTVPTHTQEKLYKEFGPSAKGRLDLDKDHIKAIIYSAFKLQDEVVDFFDQYLN